MIQILFQRTVNSYQFNLSMKAQCASKFILTHLLGPVGSHGKVHVNFYANFKQLKMKILSRITHCCSDQNRKWIKQLAGLLRPQERKATYQNFSQNTSDCLRFHTEQGRNMYSVSLAIHMGRTAPLSGVSKHELSTKPSHTWEWANLLNM